MTSILPRKSMTGFSREQYYSKSFSLSYFYFLQKYFVSKFAVKVLESSLLQQYAKIHQRTFFRVSFKVCQFSFDIFISIYRMNLISLSMNQAMLGHRFKYQELCAPTISCRFKAIWSQSFDAQLFQMRFSRTLQRAFFNFFRNLFTFTLILSIFCVVWRCFFTNK